MTDEMSKQGLFLWLKSVVEAGSCPGVTWTDKDDGTFKIPWSNQKSRNWQKEDSSLFLEYAKHTCKFKLGDKMDYPKWKQNLKSAINKNRFIERVRLQDRLSGPKPYRVYRFLSASRSKMDDNAPELDTATNFQNDSMSFPSFEDSGFSMTPGVALDRAVMPRVFLNPSLSPDLPRGDFVDQVQGNIPTIVSDENDLNLWQESDASVVDSPNSASQTSESGSVNRFQASPQQTQQELISQQSFVVPQASTDFIRTYQIFNYAVQNTLEIPGIVNTTQAPSTFNTTAQQPSPFNSTAQEPSPSNVIFLNQSTNLRLPSNHVINSGVLSETEPPRNTTFTAWSLPSSDNRVVIGGQTSGVSSTVEQFENIGVEDFTQNPETQNMAYRTHEMLATPTTSCQPQAGVEESLMHIEVLYGTPHRTVKRINVTSRKSSCRLFFGAVNCKTLQDEIRGYQDAEEIELPSIDKLDELAYSKETKIPISKILDQLELGIVISYRNGDIFVERRCLPRVFLSDGISTSETLIRSTRKRAAETKAFDYNGNFTQVLERHKKHGDQPVPRDHFLLTVGYEILKNDESPTRKVPVYIVVRHVLAAQKRFQILGVSTIAPNPMLSDPNSFDKTVQLFKELDIKKE